MSLVLLLLLAATGSLLMFVYRPLPEEAYESIVRIQESILFGGLVRGVHHWSANLLVVIVPSTSCASSSPSATTAPRQLNWLVGLALLALAAGSNFTGYLLPWDQLSYWAVTIVTGMVGYVPLVGAGLQQLMRGGERDRPGDAGQLLHPPHPVDAGGDLLPRRLPLLAGPEGGRGRPPARSPREENGAAGRVLFLPNLLMREVAFALALVAAVTLFAALVRAPLGEAANPGMSPNPAKAPWYFLGFQELLVHFHPLLRRLRAAARRSARPRRAAVPAGGERAARGVVPLGNRAPHGPLRRPRGARRGAGSRRCRRIPVGRRVGPGGARRPRRAGCPPGSRARRGGRGVPSARRRRLGASRLEATQALFVLLVTAFALLTVTGIWFRGAGMRLAWPWLT